MYDEERTKWIKPFPAAGTFAAITAAKNWLEARGYSVGSMFGNEPIGFKHGSFIIAKWHNLGDDRAQLDGVIISSDFREGGCQIEFWSEPKPPEEEIENAAEETE